VCDLIVRLQVANTGGKWRDGGDIGARCCIEVFHVCCCERSPRSGKGRGGEVAGGYPEVDDVQSVIMRLATTNQYA
jgi:hypothetical protein